MIDDVQRVAGPGRRIVQVDWAGTVVFVIVSVLAAVLLGGIRPVAVAVDLALFAIGCAAFLYGYGVAVQRSRTDEIGVGGLFFLGGQVAPSHIRWSLNLALAVQVVAALVTASVRPFTTLAFGILVPMFGLGLNGLWGARHGTFGPRRLEADGGTNGAPETGDDRDVHTPADDTERAKGADQNAGGAQPEMRGSGAGASDDGEGGGGPTAAATTGGVDEAGGGAAGNDVGETGPDAPDNSGPGPADVRPPRSMEHNAGHG